jgi:hypothetical protein
MLLFFFNKICSKPYFPFILLAKTRAKSSQPNFPTADGNADAVLKLVSAADGNADAVLKLVSAAIDKLAKTASKIAAKKAEKAEKAAESTSNKAAKTEKAAEAKTAKIAQIHLAKAQLDEANALQVIRTLSSSKMEMSDSSIVKPLEYFEEAVLKHQIAVGEKKLLNLISELESLKKSPLLNTLFTNSTFPLPDNPAYQESHYLQRSIKILELRSLKLSQILGFYKKRLSLLSTPLLPSPNSS